MAIFDVKHCLNNVGKFLHTYVIFARNSCLMLVTRVEWIQPYWLPFPDWWSATTMVSLFQNILLQAQLILSGVDVLVVQHAARSLHYLKLRGMY